MYPSSRFNDKKKAFSGNKIFFYVLAVHVHTRVCSYMDATLLRYWLDQRLVQRQRNSLQNANITFKRCSDRKLKNLSWPHNLQQFISRLKKPIYSNTDILAKKLSIINSCVFTLSYHYWNLCSDLACMHTMKGLYPGDEIISFCAYVWVSCTKTNNL